MKQIPEEVLEVLKAGKIEDNTFFLSGATLDRKLYVAVNEVLENAGGKWNRKIEGHVFENDPSEKLGLAIETGTTVNKKQELQFFETPRDVAERVIELADIQDGMTVLEPSAGQGAILDCIDKALDIGVVFVEIDPENCEVLKQKNYQGYCEDFMKYSLASCDVDKDPREVTDEDMRYCLGQFERIVMNPPFTKQQDIDHVMKAWEHLANGGRLVSVMSPGFTFRTNKKSVAFKKLVEENGSWEKVAEGSFKESGTGVNTVIVVLNKPS